MLLCFVVVESMNFLNCCWVGIARHGAFTAQWIRATSWHNRNTYGYELFYKGEGWCLCQKIISSARKATHPCNSVPGRLSPLLDNETVESKTGGKVGCVTRFTKHMMMLKGKWMTMVWKRTAEYGVFNRACWIFLEPSCFCATMGGW